MAASAFEFLRRGAFLLIPRMPLLGADYGKSHVMRDLASGITVAAVLIPQSMAYALLAGLPPVNGLYAALFGGIAGSLWSNSRYLATGPIAIVSLLTLTAVSPLAPPGSPQFIALVAALALLVGLIQIGLGLSRLGFLVRLVPQSVLAGFSSAAAIVIVLTQVPHLFGFSVSQGDFLLQQAANIVTHFIDSHLFTTIVGCCALLLLMSIRYVLPRLSPPLLVLVAGIFASFMFDLEAQGVALAGTIPAELPITNIPIFSLTVLLALIAKAFVIALVGFMSSYAVVKEMSGRTKERVNADQELIGQGFANLFSGLFRGYPVGGSISRTAVNFEAGAVTAWSGVFASVIVVLAILFLSPILAYLPNAVLAAIVITAVLPMIDIANLRRIYEVARTDGAIALTTFAGVFLLRPDEAVLIGVLLALVLYMRKMMWVHVIEVGIHPRFRALTSLRVAPEATVFPRILMLRVDAPIFYANVERLALEIKERLREREAQGGDKTSTLVLDCSGVNHADVTGIDGLRDLVHELRSRGIKLYCIGVRYDLREILDRGGLTAYVRFLHGVRELEALAEAYSTGDSKHMLLI